VDRRELHRGNLPEMSGASVLEAGGRGPNPGDRSCGPAVFKTAETLAIDGRAPPLRGRPRGLKRLPAAPERCSTAIVISPTASANGTCSHRRTTVQPSALSAAVTRRSRSSLSAELSGSERLNEPMRYLGKWRASLRWERRRRPSASASTRFVVGIVRGSCIRNGMIATVVWCRLARSLG
jgi:hypothetical protein